MGFTALNCIGATLKHNKKTVKRQCLEHYLFSNTVGALLGAVYDS